MSIKALPKDVVDRINSSATITSLNGVICDLIKNSLDAGATKINISVNYGRGNCSVEDDGEGILPSEFKNDGGLLKLHRIFTHCSSLVCHRVLIRLRYFESFIRS
jgi:DNA mismatch repair protein MLH3